ncbi:hypothetical protein [Methylovulum psychrotolerans]|jgi:hypothetical protein|uniref:Uncharacterized protein n=1 Tax=Methylovulum psychrotolerans TaxID=1704499 RepID=A0A2S5CJV5_9GAMM|nr:hypothetical protein [Methylovulum psychrotolerans]MBT9096897.1 hypothetical protein [Methylovulum psychrotolerans]POZ51091.1 hypothetical protein AADEFJLK_03049 [Methylovulum psychrotolerans]
MAFRSTITLTDQDQEILEHFKKELGIESSSQAVATALQIADYIRESTKKGEIIFKKDASGEAKTIKFIGL